jgi:hypothetical protein
VERTPNPKQFYQLLELFDERRFGSNANPGFMGDFEYTMQAIEKLGDTRAYSAEQLIGFLEGLPYR